MTTREETINIAINAYLANQKRVQAEIDAFANYIKNKARQMGASFREVGEGMKAVSTAAAGKNIDAAVDQLEKLDHSAKRAHKGLLTLSNFLRTAFGTLTAIGIFAILQGIQRFFTGALKSASDFRSEVAELNLAEAILSKKGMDITRQEFDDLIADIESKSQFLSKLDATKVVADTAGAVQEFDVSKEQLKDLADSIAFIQVKNKLLGREEADAAHIINAAMDARSNFFNGMGINITELLIKEKAYAMELATTGEELDKATRWQAVMALLTEQTAEKQEELNRQLEGTPLGNQLKFQKEWENVSLRLGQSFITVKDNLVEFLTSFSPDLANSIVDWFVLATNDLNIFIDSLQDASAAVKALNDFWVLMTGHGLADSKLPKVLENIVDMLTPFENLLALIQIMGASLATIFAPIITLLAELAAGVSIRQAMSDAGAAAGEAFVSGVSIALETQLKGEDGKIATWVKEQWQKATGVDLDTFQSPRTPKEKDRLDTPTAILPKEPSPVDDDLQKALEKMNDEILEAQIKFAQDIEEIEIDLGRKREDIALEYAQKRADIERDYAAKIRDINAQYASTLASIAAKQQEAAQQARNEELEREAKFQEQMRQLKEKFLMDLEEALHARDARQILRLIKQYSLDKAQAERERALEEENAKRESELRTKRFAQEREEAERERREKLAEAARDYQDKLNKLMADEAAERAAAELAAKRKREDLEREMHDRLEIIGANLINEFNLTKDGLDAIVALYRSYYAEIAGIYAAMNSMLAGQGRVGGTAPTAPSPTQGAGTGLPPRRYAKGGMVLADRPTQAVFGEAGMELATFTPIGRQGTDVNKLFSNLSGGGGGNGSSGMVGVEVLLSPDLEARIVKNTLNKTAQVFVKAQRTKR